MPICSEIDLALVTSLQSPGLLKKDDGFLICGKTKITKDEKGGGGGEVNAGRKEWKGIIERDRRIGGKGRIGRGIGRKGERDNTGGRKDSKGGRDRNGVRDRNVIGREDRKGRCDSKGMWDKKVGSDTKEWSDSKRMGNIGKCGRKG